MSEPNQGGVPFDQEALLEAGFAGGLQLLGLDSSRVPPAPGVYRVVRPSCSPP